jgi:hypothetical protein
MGSIGKFSIPAEFQHALTYSEPKDTRSDAEILEFLQHFTPVTSEKNIWAFWDKGLKRMPAWCQRNVIDWVRICGPDWTVRILDAIPGSETNALKYISPDLLPESFVKGTMTGAYTGPHSSDFLRGACLWSHGGAYMDVGNILIRDFDRVCWNQLADANSPFNVCIPVMYDTTGQLSLSIASSNTVSDLPCSGEPLCSKQKGRSIHQALVRLLLFCYAEHRL